MVEQRSNARLRLQQAAVQLFKVRGFDGVTAAEIAARAGVTERTFFRYFADKREVLFDGQVTLVEALASSIADAPNELGPLNVLFRAFRSVTQLLENNRSFSKPRQEVISANPALHERELMKIETLSNTLATALAARGVPDLQAALAARIGIAAFVNATLAWLENEEPSLGARLDLNEKAVKTLL